MSGPDVSPHVSRLIALREELSTFVVGQEALIERLLIALLADGHILLEGVPGLAKTRVLSTLTRSIDVHMSRVQFTPDLLPSDLIGTEVYRPQSGEFVIRHGPIFTNLLLADEINRAPAKVQSALLQAMQEREVTIGEQTFRLPAPFMVLATQNPIEQEGTYRLPEAQLDRFLMKINVTYPSFEDEVRVVDLVTRAAGEEKIPKRVMSAADLIALRQEVSGVHADPKIDRYIVSLVHASREAQAYGLEGMVDWGASPRASIALKVCSRCLAYLQGRNYIIPEDVKTIAPDVLRHRILPSFEAEARGINSDQIITTLLSSVTAP